MLSISNLPKDVAAYLTTFLPKRDLCHLAWAIRPETTHYIELWDKRLGRTQESLQMLFSLLETAGLCPQKTKEDWLLEYEKQKVSIVNMSDAESSIVLRHVQALFLKSVIGNLWQKPAFGEVITKIPVTLPECCQFLLSVSESNECNICYENPNENPIARFWDTVVAEHARNNNYATLVTKCWETRRLKLIQESWKPLKNYFPGDQLGKMLHTSQKEFYRYSVRYPLLQEPFVTTLQQLLNAAVYGISVNSPEETEQDLRAALAIIAGVHVEMKTLGLENLSQEFLAQANAEGVRLVRQFKQNVPKEAYSVAKRIVVVASPQLYLHLNKLHDAVQEEKQIDETWRAIPEELVKDHAVTFAWMIGRCRYQAKYSEKIQSISNEFHLLVGRISSLTYNEQLILQTVANIYYR